MKADKGTGIGESHAAMASLRDDLARSSYQTGLGHGSPGAISKRRLWCDLRRSSMSVFEPGDRKSPRE